MQTSKVTTIDVTDLPLSDGDNQISAVALNDNMLPSSNSGEVVYTTGDFEYFLSNDGEGDYYTILSKGNVADQVRLTIPDNVGGIPVKKIADEAFYMDTDIRFVTIPASVTEIGVRAFANCPYLVQVVFRDEDYTRIYFRNNANWSNIMCYYQIASVPGVWKFAEMTLADAQQSIYLYKSSEKITNMFFAGKDATGNTSQTSYITSGIVNDTCWAVSPAGNGRWDATIVDYTPTAENPDSLVIKDEAFMKDTGAPNFTDMYLPKRLTRIGAKAFMRATDEVTFKDGSWLEEIGWSAFANCMFSNIELPNSLKRIGRDAFADCTNLKSIVIPDSVTRVDQAFDNCKSLETLVVGANVERFGGAAACTSLTTVDLSRCSKLERLGVFTSCVALTSIIIPESVKLIYKDAFAGCTALSTVGFKDVYGWGATVAIYVDDEVVNVGTMTAGYLEPDELKNTKTSCEYLTDTYSACYWVKIDQLLAPLLDLENKALEIYDGTGFAEKFRIFVNDNPVAIVDASTGALTLITN